MASLPNIASHGGGRPPPPPPQAPPRTVQQKTATASRAPAPPPTPPVGSAAANFGGTGGSFFPQGISSSLPSVASPSPPGTAAVSPSNAPGTARAVTPPNAPGAGRAVTPPAGSGRAVTPPAGSRAGSRPASCAATPTRPSADAGAAATPGGARPSGTPSDAGAALPPGSARGGAAVAHLAAAGGEFPALMDIPAAAEYAEEEEKAETALQRRVLARLRAWDKRGEAKFGADEVMHVIRVAQSEHRAVSRSHQRERELKKQEGVLDWHTCRLAAGAGLKLLVVFFCVVLAMVLSQDLRLEGSSVLSAAFSDDSGLSVSAAAGTALTRRDLGALPRLELRDLRRVVSCTFVHRGSVVALPVASLSRRPAAGGAVRLRAPDHRVLSIEADGSRAVLERPFYGAEPLDLNQLPSPWLMPRVSASFGKAFCDLSALAASEGRAAR